MFHNIEECYFLQALLGIAMILSLMKLEDYTSLPVLPPTGLDFAVDIWFQSETRGSSNIDISWIL